MASANWTWQAVFSSLNQWGLTDVLLPFLLIFTVLFAVLQKTRILGKGSKKYNVVVSFVMAFMFVMPHVLGEKVLGYDPVALLNSVLPTASVVVVAFVLLLLFIGVFAAGEFHGAKGLIGWFAGISFLVLFYIFGAAAGWWYGWSWLSGLLGGSDTIAVIVMLVVFGIIIAYITGEEKESSFFKDYMESADKMFK